MGGKGGVIGFIANRTSIGRMITKGESFGEAWVNAGKQTLQDAKDFGVFVADRTPTGRMIKNGENYLDAFNNSNAQIGKDIFGE